MVTDEEKASEVIDHVKRKRSYSLPLPEVIAAADLVIGDRNDYSNKYDILKYRWANGRRRTVLHSTKQLLNFLRSGPHGIKILWVLPR